MKRFPKDVVIAEAHRQAHDTEYLNKEAERDSGPYKFVGSTYDLAPELPSDTKLGFYCSVQIGTGLGVGGLLVNGTILEVPGLVGDTRRMKIRGATIEGNTATLEDEHCLAHIERIDGEWRMSALINKKVLERVKFV